MPSQPTKWGACSSVNESAAVRRRRSEV